MLTMLELENVRSWEKATIPLSPLTVIVGPNAGGKTTLLEAIEVLGLSIEHHLSRGVALPNAFKLLRSNTDEMTIRVRSTDKAETFQLIANRKSAAFLRVTGRNFEFDTQLGRTNVDPVAAQRIAERWRTHLLRLELGKLGANSYSDEVVPSLGIDGANLASVLAWLKLEAADKFEDIVERAKRIIPGLRTIKVTRAPVSRSELRRIVVDGNATNLTENRSYMGHGVVLEMDGAPEVKATEAGEGTLLVVGLLVALRQARAPRIALLDDIEMRLHPAAQARLIAAMREMMASGTPTQIVGTTHSPFFLQHVEASEVVVVDHVDGRSQAARLTDHPQYSKWKDTMGVGEFWSSVGEQWLRKTA